MPRPSNLIDTVHDFGSNLDIPYVIGLDSTAFSEAYASKTDWNKYANMVYHVKHFCLENTSAYTYSQGNLPPTGNIDKNGNLILSTTPVSGDTWRAIRYVNIYDTPNHSIGTTAGGILTTVGVTDLRPNTVTAFSNGKLTKAGSYQNVFSFYWRCQNCSDTYLRWDQYLDKVYYYNVFQKSVAIIQDITTVPIVVNGQTVVAPSNNIVRLNKSTSRGKEVDSNWLIQAKDNNGNFNTAIQGVDYLINSGTLGSDIIELKFLQQKQFKIICVTNGFISTNNNFFSKAGTGSVTTNNDSTFYIINVSEAIDTKQDTIILPKINAIVSIQNQTATNPVQQGYAGATISITGSIDISTGTYVEKDIISNTQTNVILTEAQWLNEINTRSNITLEIRNKSDNSLTLTKYGIGPHNNIIISEGDYLIQYKTILK